MQHEFIWHDLMTSDVEAAKTFYAEVVGWTFNDQMPGYHVAEAEGNGMGGIMLQPDHLKSSPPFWSGYIHVTDVDAATAKLKALGGTVHREPWDVPEVGRIAVGADPSGAMFNIMTPMQRENAALLASSAIGAVGWNEAHVGELDRDWNFYSNMFGWTKGEAVDMGPAGIYQVFQSNGKDHGGMMKRMAQTPHALWLYYFNVDGIDAAVTRLTKAGGKVVMGPHQVPGGQWIVSAFDPQGANFQLISKTK